MLLTPPRRSKFLVFLRYAGVPLAILLFAAAPLLGVFLADAIAQSFHCRISEAGGGICMIGGMDWGSTLEGLMVAGWLGLITLPTGAILMAGYILYLFISGIVRRRRSSYRSNREIS